MTSTKPLSPSHKILTVGDTVYARATYGQPEKLDNWFDVRVSKIGHKFITLEWGSVNIRVDKVRFMTATDTEAVHTGPYLIAKDFKAYCARYNMQQEVQAVLRDLSTYSLRSAYTSEHLAAFNKILSEVAPEYYAKKMAAKSLP